VVVSYVQSTAFLDASGIIELFRKSHPRQKIGAVTPTLLPVIRRSNNNTNNNNNNNINKATSLLPVVTCTATTTKAGNKT
jgi:hypothetical protein